jgi:hypothetical protein
MVLYLRFFFSSANVCGADGIANAAIGVDYSSCVGNVTGDICVPVCAVDCVAETTATGFALTCDSAGNFDGADATLVCIGHCPPLFAQIFSYSLPGTALQAAV